MGTLSALEWIHIVNYLSLKVDQRESEMSITFTMQNLHIFFICLPIPCLNTITYVNYSDRVT